MDQKEKSKSGPIYLDRLRARLGWVPYFVLVVALAGTALGTWYVASTERERSHARFQNEVRDTIDQIANRITVYENLLQGTAGLFSADRDVSREEFRRYIDELDLSRRYPGIQGIGYAVRVPRERLDEFEESVRENQPGFHVWPPVEDDFALAIKYLEPMDERNRAAIGYDMSSEETRF
ncbi:MAG: CHASE domain-containing protein, partial [Thermoanaerobaculia bacterium]|nr:CHASE domain-containing protein [Thermoanaerobaculia bacterium]